MCDNGAWNWRTVWKHAAESPLAELSSGGPRSRHRPTSAPPATGGGTAAPKLQVAASAACAQNPPWPFAPPTHVRCLGGAPALRALEEARAAQRLAW